VVGILNKTLTAPDAFAYISTTDGQMLLKDSLPAPLQSAFDVSQIAENITVYGKPGTSLSELDKIADRINSQVTGVKAPKAPMNVASRRNSAMMLRVVAPTAFFSRSPVPARRRP
jgi:hypothetical protein